MVMENQEMVMVQSWKNIFSSMWEPCSEPMNNVVLIVTSQSIACLCVT